MQVDRRRMLDGSAVGPNLSQSLTASSPIRSWRGRYAVTGGTGRLRPIPAATCHAVVGIVGVLKTSHRASRLRLLLWERHLAVPCPVAVLGRQRPAGNEIPLIPFRYFVCNHTPQQAGPEVGTRAHQRRSAM